MPIFEYACRDCGREFEAFVTQARTPACPGCDSDNLAKRLSSPGMVGATSAARSERPFPAAGGGCGQGMCGCKVN